MSLIIRVKALENAQLQKMAGTWCRAYTKAKQIIAKQKLSALTGGPRIRSKFSVFGISLELATIVNKPKIRFKKSRTLKERHALEERSWKLWHQLEDLASKNKLPCAITPPPSSQPFQTILTFSPSLRNRSFNFGTSLLMRLFHL